LNPSLSFRQETNTEREEEALTQVHRHKRSELGRIHASAKVRVTNVSPSQPETFEEKTHNRGTPSHARVGQTIMESDINAVSLLELDSRTREGTIRGDCSEQGKNRKTNQMVGGGIRVRRHTIDYAHRER
jgi:hypothetical protein